MSHAFVSSRKRSFHQIEGSESEELSPDGCTHFFETYLRGARHHNTETLQVNDVLSCIKEPSNPADPNAIALHQRIEDGPIKVGYFSRELAAQLAPLMDLDCLSIEVTVLSKENRNKIRIQVALQGHELQSMIPELIHLANSNERDEFTNRVLCQNLSLLLETVSSQNPYLLHRCEKDTYLELRNLDRVSLCVLLRLYLRKGTWFRVRRLDYFNIELLEDRVNDLVTNELLESSSSLGVVATMTVEEMKIFLKDRKRTEWKLRLTGNKHQLVSETTRLLQEYPQLIDELQSNFGRAVRVHGRVKCALQVAERLYFLDEVHDLSSFLTAELDLVRWPQYQIQIQQKVFPDRNSFDSYFTSMNELTDLESWIKMNDDQSIEGLLGVVWKRLESGEHKKLNWSSNGTISCLPNPLPVHEVSNKTPLFLARFTSIWITVKLATVGVAYLEKRKQYKLAIEKLRTLLGGNCCPFSRGHWWNRLIINLKHLKKFTLALEACNCALSDNWVRHGSLYSIKRHYLKLSRPPRRWKRPTWASQVDESIKMTRIEASPLERVPGCKSQFRGRTGVVSVEQLALEYYQDHGDWRGVYTEGTLWTTLFGVLFWDVIFSDLEDVFRTPFQNCPLDFATDSFFESRRNLIEKRIAEIETGEFLNSFLEVWSRENGVLCHGVYWDKYHLDDLKEIMQCIGGRKLASICRLFAEDYKSIRGGLPDLFLWRIEQKECKLSEVKGPRDSLSDKQRSWIGLLTTIGFNVEVFKIIKQI